MLKIAPKVRERELMVELSSEGKMSKRRRKEGERSIEIGSKSEVSG